MRIDVRLSSAIGLAIVSGLVLLDVFLDAASGGDATHIALETAIAIVALTALAILVRDWHRNRDRVQALDRESSEWKARSRKWIHGLAAEMDRQMDRWGLTAAEKDVAFLLIKGLSTKEISAVRHRSEQTIRTQASSIYAKAGVSGRVQLTAWFLDDLWVEDSSEAPNAPG